MPNFYLRSIFMRFLLLLFPLSLWTHDIWIEKQSDSFVLQYGHLHLTQEHQGRKVIPYDPNNIQEVICKNGSNIDALKREKHYPLTIYKKCDSLYIRLDNGYFTKTPYGIKNLPKNSVKMPLKSWRSYESVKRIEKGEDKVLSNSLEILLLNSPKEIGDKAHLQLFYQQKPIEGIAVAYDGKVRGVSDKNGKINIRIKHSGIQNIQATRKEPSAHSELYDETIFTTTLNFEVKE